MTNSIEVVVRLGETIVDVQYVTDGYALAGELLALEPGVTRRGLMDITMTRVERPARSLPHAPHGDRRALTYVAASLAVHLLVWGVTPAPEDVIERRPAERVARLVAPPRARPLPPAFDRGDSPAFARNGGGSPTHGEAGAAGGNSSSLKGRIQIAKRHEVPQVARANALAKVGKSGILAALDGHGFEAIVGRADLSSGFDRSDVHAPLYGGEGAGRGTFGLARSGTGDSAGCAGGACPGIIGVGSYGALSNGTGSGYGWGGGRGGMQGRETKYPRVFPCAGPRPCHVEPGGLDKSIVKRYVKRATSKISFCYEKELLASPHLAGEVSTQFLIGLDGKVHESTATGVSLAVASCVADVIRGIEFPRSKDGVTQVNYPFTFRAAGS